MREIGAYECCVRACLIAYEGYSVCCACEYQLCVWLVRMCGSCMRGKSVYGEGVFGPSMCGAFKVQVWCANVWCGCAVGVCVCVYGADMCGARTFVACMVRVCHACMWSKCVNAGVWCVSGCACEWCVCVVRPCVRTPLLGRLSASERAFYREFVWCLLRVCIVRENA